MASLVLSGDTSGTVTLAAPAVAGTQSYTLPTAVPAANGYALTSTTGGTMSWAAVSASPAGSTTQVQYNSSGAFAGSANLTFDGTSLTVNTIKLGLGTGAVSTNIAIGANALSGANTGSGFNIALGPSSLLTNTSGTRNVSIGFNSMYYNNGGTSNCAIGFQSVQSNTSGGSNTGIGQEALFNNTTASNNTALGYQAGYGLITGSNNTYLGTNATQSGTAVTGEIVLCTASSVGKGSNTGYINTSGGVYQGNNSAAWSVTSDQRLKKNIVGNNVGLDAINAVQVRNFEYRLPEEIDSELESHCAIAKEGVQLGVIAQELQAVLPDCVKQESTGVLSVDSDPLTWYMVNAIKQLSAKLDEANARIAALEAK